MSSGTHNTAPKEGEIAGDNIVYIADSAIEVERQRLNYQHVALTLLLDGELLVSTLKQKPTNVLDLATGTAKWAYDFAKKYPESTVTGVDVTKALDPNPPPNFNFEILDIQQDWTFPELFDIIHGRLLFTIQLDFPRLFAQAYNNLAPGGCFELQECMWPFHHDGYLDPASSGALLLDGLTRGIPALGLDWGQTSNFDAYMREQGFVDVQVKSYRAPFGEWSENAKEKEVGRIMGGECYPRYLPAWKVVWIKGLGWSDDKIKKIERDLKADIESQKARFWLEYRVITGKKPE